MNLPVQPATTRTAADALRAPGENKPIRSLYIHIPFCSHKCHYCDFYSFVDTKDQQSVFVDRLIDELTALAPHAAGAPLRTIFIGGGTPSLLRLELWERLLAAMDERFDLSLIRASHEAHAPTRASPALGHQREARACAAGLVQEPPAEFTVECNPESASPELMHLLRSGGVTRISMGAQSFNPAHLRTLERTHNPDNVPRAVGHARAAGFERVSIDLIYAIPGQSLDEWQRDLRAALELRTTHLSCYNLTYEPNTLMTNRLKRGEFVPVAEELETEMFLCASRELEPRGLRRYEVSNYAVPGQESRHNLAYWRQEEWLAAGPSASGHAGGHRWKNIGNLAAYLASSGYSPVSDHEPPDAARAVRERIMTGIRLAEGIELEVIAADAERAAPGSGVHLRTKAAEFVGDGLLAFDAASRLRVTERGWLTADFLARKLMAAVV